MNIVENSLAAAARFEAAKKDYDKKTSKRSNRIKILIASSAAACVLIYGYICITARLGGSNKLPLFQNPKVELSAYRQSVSSDMLLLTVDLFIFCTFTFGSWLIISMLMEKQTKASTAELDASIEQFQNVLLHHNLTTLSPEEKHIIAKVCNSMEGYVSSHSPIYKEKVNGDVM